MEVPVRTIVHHLQRVWVWQPSSERYYFCDEPACEVVYFGDDDSTVLKSQLRTPVGIKDPSDDGLLCYCYGVTRRDFSRDPSTREFVLAKTKVGDCSCEVSNPAGRCCLKDFPKPGQ